MPVAAARRQLTSFAAQPAYVRGSIEGSRGAKGGFEGPSSGPEGQRGGLRAPRY